MGRLKKTKTPDKFLQAARMHHDNPALTQAQIGKLVGCSAPNINRAFKQYNLDWKKTQDFKSFEADLLAGYQERILRNGITDDKIDKATLKDITLSAAILADKRDMIQRKTASRELLSDIIERLATQRKITKITIEQSEQSLDVNLDNTQVIDTQIIADVS